MKPIFSIIIPALNEEDLLPRLLKSIQKQTYKEFEVIVVDANSTDRTVLNAQKFKKELGLKIISTKHHNVSDSRNLGAQKASGKYYFFIDADNQIDSNLLQKAKRIADKGYFVIIPFMKPDSNRVLYKIFYSAGNYLVLLCSWLGLSFSTSGSMIIRNDIFKKINGFNSKIYIGEEHDIVSRARRAGAKIFVARNAMVTVSSRRFEKDGILVFVMYFFANLYIIFFGKITKRIYNYRMGGDYYSK